MSPIGARNDRVICRGCTVGPNYKRPAAVTPAKWDVAEPWRESAPKDAFPKGEWWSVFHDDELNALEKQALAEIRRSRFRWRIWSRRGRRRRCRLSTLFPTLGTAPSIERQRLSGNRPPNSNIVVTSPVTQNSYTLPFTVSYEVDLFGRRRRSIEAAEAAYQANTADTENVRLLVTSQLAGDYFSLRQLDSELGILNRTVDALQKGSGAG